MATRNDSFNRANGALNGSAPSDGGSAWACVNGGSVSGNAFAHGGGGSEYNSLAAGASDVDVAATVTVLPGAFGRFSLMFRGADSSNFWRAEMRATSPPTGSASCQIIKRVAGSDTIVATLNTGPALGAGAVFRVSAVADRVRVYHTPNGGSESLILDTGTGQTFNQTATAHGFGGSFNDATVRWDNLTITDLGGGGAPVTIVVGNWW